MGMPGEFERPEFKGAMKSDTLNRAKNEFPRGASHCGTGPNRDCVRLLRKVIVLLLTVWIFVCLMWQPALGIANAKEISSIMKAIGIIPARMGCTRFSRQAVG